MHGRGLLARVLRRRAHRRLFVHLEFPAIKIKNNEYRTEDIKIDPGLSRELACARASGSSNASAQLSQDLLHGFRSKPGRIFPP